MADAALAPERVAARWAEVQERLAAALARTGRTDSVTVVAVTKGHPPAAVDAALALGLRDIGENRVQELEAKVAVAGRDRATWHLLGPLQRNKIRRALPLVDRFHALDSLRIAESLSTAAEMQGRRLPVLVEVNCSGEATKHGFRPDETLEVLARLVEFPGLAIEGLMTMAPWTDHEPTLRATFRCLRRLRDAAAARWPQVHHLSMGMSNDYPIAVEEGSTIVRLGTALFGERPT
jgi:pyridoxal phosphate enzyme (YggS family)